MVYYNSMKSEVCSMNHRSYEDYTITSQGREKLSDLLIRHQIPCPMPCGGKGKCYKCKIIARGDLSPISSEEKEHLTKDELDQGTRFACMTLVEGTVTLSLPMEGKSSILEQGSLPPFTLAPLTKNNAALKGWGVAVDIGTTTLVAYLYSLEDGTLIDTRARPNPQGAYGADVLTRIEKALAGQGAELAASIRNALRDMMASFEKPLSIAVITGNTTMLYLLEARCPKPLAFAPFDADCLYGVWYAGDALSLPVVHVYLPRCVSAFVGADITCSMLTAGFTGPFTGPRLLVDIGTNGEMALWHEGGMLSCSTAAGPAFEGAGISMGMPAMEGAIHRVFVAGNTVTCDVIGDVAAKGICGSGLVDAIAAMVQLEIIDETGYLEEDCYTLPGTNVSITQEDVRKVQLAKASICAGLETLLHEAGITPEHVSEFIIAGGFGSYIRGESAQTMGLIPKGLLEKSRTIGNGAGMGAAMILLGEGMLEASEKMAEETINLSLATHPYFMERYIERMGFEEE